MLGHGRCRTYPFGKSLTFISSEGDFLTLFSSLEELLVPDKWQAICSTKVQNYQEDRWNQIDTLPSANEDLDALLCKQWD